LLCGELLVQVLQFETGVGQFLDARRENSRLQRRHGCLELGCDQGEGFVFEVQALVEIHCIGHQRGVELEELVVEQLGEVEGQFFPLLQTTLDGLRKHPHVRHLGHLVFSLLVVVVVVDIHIGFGQQPADQGVKEFRVLLLLYLGVLEYFGGADHAEAAAFVAWHIEGTDGAVGGLTDGARVHDGESGFHRSEPDTEGLDDVADLLVDRIVLHVVEVSRGLGQAADHAVEVVID